MSTLPNSECYGLTEPKPINAGEAIFLPAFDGTLHDFSKLEVEGGELKQMWDCCLLRTSRVRAYLRWNGNTSWTGYDALRFFVAFPSSVRLNGRGRLNGKWCELFRDVHGESVPIEPTSLCLVNPNGRSILSGFELELQNEAEEELTFCLYWAAVINLEEEPNLSLPQPYPTDWSGWIEPKGIGALVNPWMASAGDLERAKHLLREPQFSCIRKKLFDLASKWEGYEPEPHIREFLPVHEHLFRYARMRDRGRPLWEEPLETLSLAGYLLDMPQFTRLAARLLLSVAQTPKWFEGPQGCFPGSHWHHLCFVESHMMVSALFALQFIGNSLTASGRRHVITRVTEAWKLVNRYCEEPGYRWHMNQGVVFNSARIAGAVGLSRQPGGGAFHASIEQSFLDHCTVVKNYLGKDGHCPEGPHYFAYSMRSSVPGWMAYAAHRGLPISSILPERFLAADQFLDATTSTLDECGSLLPLCASGRERWPTDLLALLSDTGTWESASYYLNKRFEVEFEGVSLRSWDVISLLIFSTALQKEQRIPSSRPIHLPSGLASFAWNKPAPGKLVLLAERPSTCHYHFDRGSIVLEAGGNCILPDPGTTNYSNSKSILMKELHWHNLAYPRGLAMACSKQENPAAPSAHLQLLTEREDCCTFVIETGMLFGPEVLAGTRHGTLQLDIGADTGVLELHDEWNLFTSRSLVVVFQSYCHWKLVRDKRRTVASAGTGLSLSFETGDNEVEVLEGCIDWSSKPLHTLRITTLPGETVALKTKLTFGLSRPSTLARKRAADSIARRRTVLATPRTKTTV